MNGGVGVVRGAREGLEQPPHHGSRCIVTGMGSKAPFHQTHIPSVRCNPKTRGGKRMLSRGETRKDREVGSSPQTAIPREKGTESPSQEEAQPLHQAHSQGPSRLWR